MAAEVLGAMVEYRSRDWIGGGLPHGDRALVDRRHGPVASESHDRQRAVIGARRARSDGSSMDTASMDRDPAFGLVVDVRVLAWGDGNERRNRR